MKLRVSKKVVFIILPVVLIAGAAGGYFYLKKDSKQVSTQTETPKSATEEKVDDVFAYLDNQTDYAKFAALTNGALVKDKLTPTDKGTPQLIIFAPKDTAFSKEDIGTFNATGADERILYHFVLLFPAADGTKPSVDLADGQKLSTIAGRDILVRKTAKKTTLIDTKGREADISSPYITDAAGNRIYPIDNVLLLQ